MSVLTLSDLNTTVNHEPRIQDLRLGKALGFARPREIRRLITDNQVELESYGGVCGETQQTSKKGGRPSISYYLNEAQAVLLCMFSRTEKAAEARKAIIEVFTAYRRGQLVSATITPDQQRALHDAAEKRHNETGLTYATIWSKHNKHFNIAKYDQLPAALFDRALDYISTMQPKKPLALPAPVATTSERLRTAGTALCELSYLELRELLGLTQKAYKGAVGENTDFVFIKQEIYMRSLVSAADYLRTA